MPVSHVSESPLLNIVGIVGAILPLVVCTYTAHGENQNSLSLKSGGDNARRVAPFGTPSCVEYIRLLV
jgi:hypothetical protein